MAATYRFYLAPRIGDGTRQNALRAKLVNYIENDGTKDFWCWVNRSTPYCYCLAFCETTLHATVAADPEIVALSPELADVAAISAWLDGLVGTLPTGVANALEAAGVPVDWIGAGTTRRLLWKFISVWHFVSQRMNDNDRQFLATNLGSRVNSLSVAARDRIQTWMTGKGLDTSWITGATTVRQVVKYIIQNGNFPIMGSGPVTF